MIIFIIKKNFSINNDFLSFVESSGFNGILLKMCAKSSLELANSFRKTIAEIIVKTGMTSAGNQFIAHQLLLLTEMQNKVVDND